LQYSVFIGKNVERTTNITAFTIIIKKKGNPNKAKKKEWTEENYENY